MFVGVNGVGKTTTIGKNRLETKKQEGNKSIASCRDTFRAGAIQQLGSMGENE